MLNNRELSDNLKLAEGACRAGKAWGVLALPNIEPVLMPEIKDPRTIKSLHRLAGFTDAEGCFFVA